MKDNQLRLLRTIVAAALLTIGMYCQAVNNKQSVSQVNETVTITTATDYTVLSVTPFGDNGVVNIENTDHAVLILAAVKPTAAINLLEGHVQIAGSPASDGQNCQVKLYNRGCIILPYGNDTKPLTVYSEQNFGGTAVNDFGLENSGGFMNTLTDEKLNNKIRSFKLKRGYMVTFSLRPYGRGYSRCFIADNADLEVSTLPNELDSKISSYRIFKWYDTGKQQLAAADGDHSACNALNVTSTYTWGVGQDMGPNIESVPQHIKENWPSPSDLGKATWSPHMKTNNEPKNPADDSPCDLNAILANWEDLMATGMRLCSPSSWDGSDYWNGTGFLKDFFDEIDARGWRCDIIDLHGYWAEGSFNTNIPNWFNAVHRPVWISEWVWGASWNHNGAFADGVTETQNAAAVKRICEKMNSLDYVERYYYWNGERDPSKVYKNGALTEAGQYYASINSGLGYNSKYTYVPKAVVRTPILSVKFTESTKTAELSWTDFGGELTTLMTVERRTSDTDKWQTLETFEIVETPKRIYYNDKNSGYGCQYRVHIVDFNGKDLYSNVYSLLKDEEAYLYNVGAGQWLTGANNYGTKASLTPYGGLNVTISSDNEGNSVIETGIVNGNNHFLNIDGTSAWVDQKEGKWAFTAVGEVNGHTAYTISQNGQCLQYDGTSSALILGSGSDANAQWLKITESERIEMLATATSTQPVDATFLIPGATFSIYDNRNSKWQGSPTLGGKQENRCAEVYNKTFDVYQNINTLLPKGRYRLSAQGFYRQGGYANAATKHNNKTEELNATLYAGTIATLPLQSIFTEAGKLNVGKTTSGINGKFPDSMSDASDYFTAGLYDNAMSFIIKSNSKLNIGIKKTKEEASDWTIFDNIRLEYLGDFNSIDVPTQTIGGRHWASFYSSVSAYELPAGSTAYTATINNNVLTLHPIGNIIPIRCAVIIISETADDLQLTRTIFTVTDDIKEFVNTNKLRGFDNDALTSKYTYAYSIGDNNGKCVFLPHTASVLPAERAFTTTTTAVKELAVEIDESPVAIHTVNVQTGKMTEDIYDMQGRRVNNPQKGIYIQNGHKIVIR